MQNIELLQHENQIQWVWFLYRSDYRQVEDDLETMWQTVTADNRRMRETMRKSVAKLKEHASLNAIIGDDDDNKEFLT